MKNSNFLFDRKNKIFPITQFYLATFKYKIEN